MDGTPAGGLHPTLPWSAYAAPEAWAADRERVFARAWHPLAPADVPAEPGAAHPFALLPGFLDEPLLLTRASDGALHALSNACTHRGAILCTSQVRARELRCPYHGRRFGLDGGFRAAPGFDTAAGATQRVSAI